MTKFDPYQRWLGIPPQDQPPHFYRLLGLELFEDDPEVIKAAAENAIAFIQQNAFGEELQQSQKLLENIEKVSAYLLSPPHKAKYDKKLKAKLGISTSEIDTTEKQIQQANHKQRTLQSQMPENSQAIQVESPSITSSIQTRKNQSQLKLLGLHFSTRWAIAGIVSLLSLTIMFYALFMGGREESSPQSQVADTKQPAKPETNSVQTYQETKAQQQNSARENRKQAKKQMQAIVEPKAEIPSAAKAFTGQFTVRADSIKKEMGKQLEDVTVDVIYQPGRDKNERFVLGTIKTDDKGQGQLEVKLTPKEQTGRFLVKLTKDNESWERRLDGFPNELSHTLTIPVAVEPEYLNPEWLEQRLEQVGIDKMIEEYQNVKAPDIQAVYSALDLSRHILRDHPEALREQLQARLLNRQEPTLAKFQVLPKQRIRVRSEWPTFNQAGGTLIRTFSGHLQSISCVAMTHDGKHAVSGARDRLLKIWDLSTGRPLHTLKGHSRAVFCVAVTPDAKYVVSGSDDKTLKIWELATGKLIQTFKGHVGSIFSIAVSPNGKHVVSGSRDKTVKIWELASGKIVKTIKGHKHSVKSITISSDGERILSGSGYSIVLNHFKTGKQMRVIKSRSYDFDQVVMTPDGQYAISGGGEPKIWDLSSGKLLRTLEKPSDYVSCLTVSSDGKQIIAGSNREICVWDFISGKLIRTIKKHIEGVNCVAISPDGKQIISGSRDKTLKLWASEVSSQIQMPGMHSHEVKCVVVSSDGKEAISGAVHELKVWDLVNDTLSKDLNKGVGFSNDNWLSYMPDKRYVISKSYSQLLGWDLTTGKISHEFLPEIAFGIVAVIPDGTQCIVSSKNKRTTRDELKVWDLTTNKLLHTLEGHEKRVTCLDVSADGKQVFSGAPNELKVWDLTSGKLLRTFEKQIGNIHCLALSQDGKRALTSTVRNRTHDIKVWDLTNGNILHSLKGHTQDINCLAVSPDAKWAVSIARGNTLKLWNLHKGKLLTTYIIDDIARDITISPDNRTLILGCQSGQVHKLLIQMAGEMKKTQPGPTILTEHEVKHRQNELAKKLNKKIRIKNSLGMELALIPEGEFLMGSSKSEVVSAKQFKLYDDDHSDEFPQHRVQISKSFYMGVHEVSYEQFQKFVKMTGYKTDVERTRKGGFGWNESTETFVSVSPKFSWRDSGWRSTRYHPVLNVTWNDATIFCAWLSRQEGVQYRLPTEAEWEYACRAGTNTLYYHGNDPKKLSEIGNIWDGTAKETFKTNYPEVTGILTEDGFAFTSPVGNYRANNWGLFDMHGNVSEWCSDFYKESYYDQFAGKPAIDPQGPQSGSTHVVRGGSWYLFPEYVRSAYRSKLPLTSCGDNVGFRVVRELE
ncbi:SUMF1/EgtB/PvdO family nonheme iron enzyme [Gimesia aquarii]|uniref:Serine/threonine-protein kinase pkn1 n=1 Tax=Gimesia aquarii TaxID=2527964 RepID=A0A517WS96_9PLAN|nr:SUMF1/EgtB/PvdO family nonheme iron enzyme [Gimesia aquarii]QDU08123.1 Serine/threonine-protein kinase pkn1 [Gimesia aquarii]